MSKRLSLSIYLSLVVLPATVFPQTTSPSSQSGQSGTGSVSGTVKVGKNPAQGVTVTLAPDRGQFQRRPQGPQAPQQGQGFRAITDENGQFRFTNVAAGAYRVIPLAEAYVVSASDSRSGGVVVNVAEGQAAPEVDLTLARGGVITGRVTDPNGRPVIAERISLTLVDESGQARPFAGGSRFGYETDDRGIFRAYGLPAGRYLISAGSGNGGPLPGRRVRYVRTWHPEAIEEAQAQIVEVAAGSVVENIDIKLNELLKSYAVEGRAVDATTGEPVFGVSVGLSRGRGGGPGGGGPGGGPGGFGAGQSGVTDEKGKFKITGLAPGRYSVSAGSSFPGAGGGQQASSDFYSEPASFEIGSDNVSGVEVKVHAGAAISGVVAVEGANDPSLAARLSQLIVSANVRGGQSAGQGGRGSASGRQSFSRVSSDGRFHISGLAPGRINLALNGFSGPGNFVVARIERNGAPLPGQLEVAQGEQVTGVVIVANYGTGVVRGRVNVVGGALPAGAMLRVSVRPLNAGGQSGNAMVGAGGAFQVEGLMTGTYEVSLTATVRGFGQGGRRPGAPGNPGTGGQASRIRFPEVKQTVSVANGRESNVTLTLDVSQQ